MGVVTPVWHRACTSYGMSSFTFTRRQALATLLGAASLVSPARAGLLVGANGPLIGRAPGPVVSLDRPQPVPQTTPQDQAAAPASERNTARAAQPRQDGTFAIPLLNANTGDQMTAVFQTAGQQAVAQDKAELDWFFRDWRQNEIKPMDPKTLSILAGLARDARAQGWDGQVRMTSGYRSRKTNNQLRSRGVGAARNSLHIQAKAIDFSFPGLDMSVLHKMAQAQAPGGVGLYRSFVHIDSRPQRRWRG